MADDKQQRPIFSYLMDPPFEQVYTINDWYDGPRTGAADYGGVPHVYRSLYLNGETWNSDEDRFELTPITSEVLGWMLEANRLNREWHSARRAGTAPAWTSGEPCVPPEDRERYLELEAKIAGALERHAGPRVLAHGEFEPGGRGVRWKPVE